MLMSLSLVAEMLLNHHWHSLQWQSAITADFDIESGSGSDLHTIHIWHVGPTIGSSFPVPQLKRQANHQRLGGAQSSKFVVFVQYFGNRQY